MKTKLLYALLGLFLFTSCSLTGDKDPEPEKTYLLQRKLSEISFTNGKGMTIEWNYTYNQDNQLTRIDAVSERDGTTNRGSTYLEYDAHTRLNLITNDFGWKWEFVYNPKNQLIELVRTYKELSPFIQFYTYNDTG
ncbi:hypothetical protein OB13_14270, partial [Pontibacter sp. HJ8]